MSTPAHNEDLITMLKDIQQNTAIIAANSQTATNTTSACSTSSSHTLTPTTQDPTALDPTITAFQTHTTETLAALTTAIRTLQADLSFLNETTTTLASKALQAADVIRMKSNITVLRTTHPHLHSAYNAVLKDIDEGKDCAMEGDDDLDRDENLGMPWKSGAKKTKAERAARDMLLDSDDEEEEEGAGLFQDDDDDDDGERIPQRRFSPTVMLYGSEVKEMGPEPGQKSRSGEGWKRFRHARSIHSPRARMDSEDETDEGVRKFRRGGRDETRRDAYVKKEEKIDLQPLKFF